MKLFNWVLLLPPQETEKARQIPHLTFNSLSLSLSLSPLGVCESLSFSFPLTTSIADVSEGMMSPGNFPPKPMDDNQSSGSNRKPKTPIKPSDQALKCPRCDSPNTKFCYYNNYSLTQPRHFCKTCRRYWTKGGALRKVPIGGGCRKSKKSRSASRLSGDQRDSESPSDTGNLKYFHGLSAAMEFPLGGLPFSRLHSNTNSVFNQYISFGDLSSALPSPTTGSLETGATSGSSLVGFNYPISSVGRQGESAVFNGGLQELGSMNVHSSIASSIESLSSINQDLHWKLQQQRLAMFFGGENQKESTVSVVPSLLLENQHQQQQQQQQQEQQPISFQTPESSKSTEICVSKNTNEWFFENSYTPTNNNINNTNINNNTINWNGIQTWSDLHQYSVLP